MFFYRSRYGNLNVRQKPYFIKDMLKDFCGFGGVRLEDHVLVTADGCESENLTVCPRAVEEVLGVMKGGVWPSK